MAIVGLERFKPNANRPGDFVAFWETTVAALSEVAPAPVVEAREAPEPGLSLEQLRFGSLGGASISGYLLRPTTGRACPLIVHAHGYNDRYALMLDWARRGASVFGFDARGFGRSALAAEISEHGYVLTGIESPATSILRGAVSDYIQAVRTAKVLLDGAATSVTFHGFSFGGALALMAGALSRDPDFVVLGQPSFGWNDERRRVSLAGSTKQINDYLARHPWRLDTVTETLRFFDTIHFAPLIEAPTLVGIGLDDDVVPSRTVLAVVNHNRCPVEVRLLPVSHSADPRESLWRDFDAEWLDYAIEGLPPDFGSPGRQVRALVA